MRGEDVENGRRQPRSVPLASVSSYETRINDISIKMFTLDEDSGSHLLCTMQTPKGREEQQSTKVATKIK